MLTAIPPPLTHHQGSCGFYNTANQRLRYQSQLPGEGLAEAWSLEDLVKLGRRIRACPYYAGRNLKEEADIVFCPYNYLIEPKIREAVGHVLGGGSRGGRQWVTWWELKGLRMMHANVVLS